MSNEKPIDKQISDHFDLVEYEHSLTNDLINSEKLFDSVVISVARKHKIEEDVAREYINSWLASKQQ